MTSRLKKKLMDQKWKRLERYGLKRPGSKEENTIRAKEAHLGRGTIRVEK